MGVTGLWRLIDSSGKPVPLETLEGKVLSIDISIWIYQVIQGYQDRRGNAVPNAHLLGLFNRICKLLYFKIKPVFVFDGGVPLLKKNTIAARKKHKAITAGKVEKIKNILLHNLMKHNLVKGVLDKNGQECEASTSTSQKTVGQINDIFKLPELPARVDESDSSDSESTAELSPRKHAKWKGNIHTVDIACDDFKALPADVRYDILTDLKETRKQNSWGRLYEMPQESNHFSNFQMGRLLKRRKVQESLETAEQEMGGKTLTLEELEQLMRDQGVNTARSDMAFRIAADSTTRLIYINDPKSLKSNEETSNLDSDSLNRPSCSTETKIPESPPKESEETLLNNMQDYDLDFDWESESESSIASPQVKQFFGTSTKFSAGSSINPALAYMIEHSGLPQEQIYALIQQQKSDDSSISSRINQKTSNKSKTSEPNFESVRRKIFPSDKSDREKENLTSASRKNPEKSLLSSSDSDSNDFVEVQDVPIPFVDPVLPSDEAVSTQKYDENDDIFADVFQNSTSELSSLETTGENSDINTSLQNPDVDTADKNSEAPPENSPSSIPSSEPLQPTKERITLANVAQKDEEQAEKSEETVTSPIASLVNEQIEPVPEPSIAKVPQAALESTKTDSSTVNKPSERVNSIITQLEADRDEILSKASEKEALLSMKSQLESTNEELKSNLGKLERQATEITEQMREEAQELLRLFGIPYVVAPQEAEAQCAYLEMIQLTDGTITDDSDIWLFGGRCVYRNFFNNAKRVMEYTATDIEHHFKLTRSQMIQLALLVGSDYTVGVPGIGPVTALEILASFPTEGEDLVRGLSKFASWLRHGRVVGPGKASLRNKLKNVTVETNFPSQAVVQAYLSPTVDESKTPFTWSKPNIVLLGDYTRDKFGWTKLKFEETMEPILKKLNESKSQKSLLSYYKMQRVPQSVKQNLSKRVQKAVEMMGNEEEQATDDFNPVEDNADQVPSKKRRKKAPPRGKKCSLEQNKVSEDPLDTDNDAEGLKIARDLHQVELIPQREKDRAEALEKKKKAIEVFKQSKKKGLIKRGKSKRPARKVVKHAELSESSDSS